MKRGSKKTGDMAGEEGGIGPEALEGENQCSVTFIRGVEEAVVGRELLGLFPCALGGVEVWRVRWEAEQFDAVMVPTEPRFAVLREVVAGSVVEDQEQLPARPLDELLEEQQERVAVEDRLEPVVEGRLLLEGDRAIDVRGLAHPKCVNVGLLTDASPGPMQAAIKPEARLIAEHHKSATSAGFFLIAGNVFRSQVACFAASARANRFRGRWMENPRSCNSRGTL